MGMEIIIKELDATTFQFINACDSTYVTDACLDLYLENGRLHYTISAIPPSFRQLRHEALDYTTYIGNPNKAIYFAFVDGQLAGQITLHKHWNNYVWVQDIAVDLKFRRGGVGGRLIKQAIDWAKEKNSPGIMLETQHNNVNACKFYERMGFQLSGFDTMLYKGLNPASQEIALFWYLLF
jgi:streptothricin acetyltransferase